MFGRSWILFVLGAAALVPYAVSQPSVRQAVTSPLSLMSKTPTDTKPDGGAETSSQATKLTNQNAAAPADGRPSAGPRPAGVAPRTTSGLPTIPFEQTLRWDVKPAWVLGNWPRVTTQLPELEMQGYRVSYVSGTTESDIAGVLTYYFDGQSKLQRIAFHGSTGDARRLVQFMLSYHHFERRFGEDPSTFLYQVEQDGKALSEMRIHAAPVIRSGKPLERFEVAFEIRHPAE